MLKNKLDKMIKKAIEKEIQDMGAYDYDLDGAVERGCEDFEQYVAGKVNTIYGDKFYDKVVGYVDNFLAGFKADTYIGNEYRVYADEYVAQWCFED